MSYKQQYSVHLKVEGKWELRERNIVCLQNYTGMSQESIIANDKDYINFISFVWDFFESRKNNKIKNIK